MSIDKINIVYWLFDETCSVPENDGYIGITCGLKNRLKQHRASKLLPRGFKVTILFEGSRTECLEKERGYRPYPNIGWNVYSGGGAGRIPSEVTKMRMSRSMKGREVPFELLVKRIGRKRPPGTGKLISLAKTGQKYKFTEASKANVRMLRTNFRHTEESKMLMSRKRIGGKRSDATKKKMALARKQWWDKKRPLGLIPTLKSKGAICNSILSFGG